MNLNNNTKGSKLRYAESKRTQGGLFVLVPIILFTFIFSNLLGPVIFSDSIESQVDVGIQEPATDNNLDGIKSSLRNGVAIVALISSLISPVLIVMLIAGISILIKYRRGFYDNGNSNKRKVSKNSHRLATSKNSENVTTILIIITIALCIVGSGIILQLNLSGNSGSLASLAAAPFFISGAIMILVTLAHSSSTKK